MNSFCEREITERFLDWFFFSFYFGNLNLNWNAADSTANAIQNIAFVRERERKKSAIQQFMCKIDDVMQYAEICVYYFIRSELLPYQMFDYYVKSKSADSAKWMDLLYSVFLLRWKIYLRISEFEYRESFRSGFHISFELI